MLLEFICVIYVKFHLDPFSTFEDDCLNSKITLLTLALLAVVGSNLNYVQKIHEDAFVYLFVK